jgi:hypothetical protein
MAITTQDQQKLADGTYTPEGWRMNAKTYESLSLLILNDKQYKIHSIVLRVPNFLVLK